MADGKTKTIRFNGNDYPAVMPDEFTIDEQLVLMHWTGMGPDALAEFDGTHIGVIAAMIEIAVARQEPRVQTRQLRAMIGGLTQGDLEAVLEAFPDEQEAEEETPPSAPAESSESSETGSTSGATSSSTGAKALVVVEASPSGFPGSDVSSASDLATSAG